jgi:hypothetical protein
MNMESYLPLQGLTHKELNKLFATKLYLLTCTQPSTMKEGVRYLMVSLSSATQTSGLKGCKSKAFVPISDVVSQLAICSLTLLEPAPH